jgi:ubiquitin-protein ligase
MINRRIQKDFMDLVFSLKDSNKSDFCYENDPKNPLDKITNMNKFTILLKGPKDTAYENGKFRLEFLLPLNYPFKPPTVKILTQIYHPNIKGVDICLDILKENWKPSYNLNEILNKILPCLLKNPNCNDPLYPDASKMYLNDRNEFNKIAAEWTAKYGL